MNNKISIVLITCLVALLFYCKDSRESSRKKLSLKEAKEIIRRAPKKDTIYVDSTGHTWYIYVKPGGMVVMLSEEDSTERQPPKPDSIQ